MVFSPDNINLNLLKRKPVKSAPKPSSQDVGLFKNLAAQRFQGNKSLENVVEATPELLAFMRTNNPALYKKLQGISHQSAPYVYAQQIGGLFNSAKEDPNNIASPVISALHRVGRQVLNPDSTWGPNKPAPASPIQKIKTTLASKPAAKPTKKSTANKTVYSGNPSSSIPVSTGIGSSNSLPPSTSKKSIPATLPPVGSLASNPSDLSRAQNLVGLQYDPQQRELLSQQHQAQVDYSRMIDDINRQLQQGVSAEQNYGNIADQKLKAIYDTLGGKLQENVGAIGDIFSQGQQQVGSAYDQAITGNQNATDKIQQLLESQAGHLGQQAALTDPLAQIQSHLQELQAMNQGSKAGGISNLATLGTQNQAIGQSAVGAAAQEGSQQRADTALQVLKATSDLGVQAQQGKLTASRALQDQTYSLGDKLQGLLGDRGKALSETLTQVQTARTSQQRQVALDSLNKQIQMATLGIEQQRLGLQSQGQAFSQQQDMATFPLQLQKLYAEINNLNANVNNKTTNDSTALAAVDKYIGNQPRTRSAVMEVLTNAQILKGGLVQALSTVPETAKKYSVDASFVANAIKLFYQNGGGN